MLRNWGLWKPVVNFFMLKWFSSRSFIHTFLVTLLLFFSFRFSTIFHQFNGYLLLGVLFSFLFWSSFTNSITVFIFILLQLLFFYLLIMWYKMNLNIFYILYSGSILKWLCLKLFTFFGISVAFTLNAI